MLTNPYPEEGVWLRGNLHAHTTESDGALSVSELVDAYERAGHDFLAVADHDTFVDPAAHSEGTDLTLLPAVELTPDPGRETHVVHVGAMGVLDTDQGRQALLDSICAGDGFAVVAHPNGGESFDHWPHGELAALDGYAGIEVYNHRIEPYPGDATAAGRWDRLLGDGRRLWGFANDDAHDPGEVGQGWNVVRASDRSPAAVRDALAAGQFYASTGVTIRSVSVDGSTVSVTTTDAEEHHLVADYGAVVARASGSHATFDAREALSDPADHRYVRVECFGEGAARAWTQPFFVEDA